MGTIFRSSASKQSKQKVIQCEELIACEVEVEVKTNEIARLKL